MCWQCPHHSSGAGVRPRSSHSSCSASCWDSWCTRYSAALSPKIVPVPLRHLRPVVLGTSPDCVGCGVFFFISCSLSCPDAPSPVILGTERPTSSPPRGCGVWAPARSPVSLSTSAVAHAEMVCRAHLGDRARNPVFLLLDLFSCVFPRLWKLRRMSLGWVPGGGTVCVGILMSVHRVPLQPLLPAPGGPPLRCWACALHPWVTFRCCSLPFGSVF